MQQHVRYITVQVCFADEPNITKFALTPLTAYTGDNVTIVCVVDSNPSSNITIFNMSHDLHGALANVYAKTEIRHVITSDNCSPKTQLKCLSENEVKSAETSLIVTLMCKLTNELHCFPGINFHWGYNDCKQHATRLYLRKPHFVLQVRLGKQN